MFKYKRVEQIVRDNKYIQYLEDIGIDTEIVLHNIAKYIEANGDILDHIFSNSSYQMLSPNIFIEEVIFREVNNYLYQNYKESAIFEEYMRLDIKSIIATQNSIIERPQIKLPEETLQGVKTDFDSENGFVRIARFENQFKSDAIRRKGQVVIFEGLSFNERNPFVHYLPSLLIWHNEFIAPDKFIVGFIKNRNSIETENLLWVNSYLLETLELKLDTYQNGLRALNYNDEVILEYRQWKSDLIGNGASFVGQDSNIAKLEGCDLILREDYFKHLKSVLPNMIFYSHRLDFE